MQIAEPIQPTGMPDSNEERQPIACEFCGALRKYEAFQPFASLPIIWRLAPCTCPEGIASYQREQDEIKARQEAEEKLRIKNS